MPVVGCRLLASLALRYGNGRALCRVPVAGQNRAKPPPIWRCSFLGAGGDKDSAIDGSLNRLC